MIFHQIYNSTLNLQKGVFTYQQEKTIMLSVVSLIAEIFFKKYLI